MDTLDLIRRLHQHRGWVNRNLLQTSAALTNEQLHAPFPIGQGSIWKSLVHMYAAEHIWLSTLHGSVDPVVPGDLPRKIPGNQQAAGALQTFDELQQKWLALEERWVDYLATLTVERLDDWVEKAISATGQRFKTRRSDILLHVATHAHYTTAQVVNMLRHSGVTKLPDVMLIALARSEAASPA